VSGACLYFATRGTDWTHVGNTLASAHPLWIIGGCGAVLAAFAIRALRWVWLLRPVAAVPVSAALSATAIGFASGVVLPLRLGELVRPALLGRRTGIGFGPALSSVVVERLLDMLVIVLCFLALSMLFPLPGAARTGARGLAAATASGFALLILAQRHRATAESWLEGLLRHLPERVSAPARRTIAGLLDGCKALGDPGALAIVLGLSVLLWAAAALMYLCAIRALDLPMPAIPGALAVMVIVTAFVFLPQAPGLVGTWQAGCVVALGLFGVPRDQAVGYSLLTWLTAMLVQLAAGGFFLAREELSWHDLIPARNPDGQPDRPRR